MEMSWHRTIVMTKRSVPRRGEAACGTDRRPRGSAPRRPARGARRGTEARNRLPGLLLRRAAARPRVPGPGPARAGRLRLCGRDVRRERRPRDPDGRQPDRRHHPGRTREAVGGYHERTPPRPCPSSAFRDGHDRKKRGRKCRRPVLTPSPPPPALRRSARVPPMTRSGRHSFGSVATKSPNRSMIAAFSRWKSRCSTSRRLSARSTPAVFSASEALRLAASRTPGCRRERNA